ncbi:hypothetical protein IW262DRAFT_510324 [Armillaria fumosa]|nr:hypothetical protein IW262DRAFT_510324 [Armillaria fumosa]
MLMLVLTFLMSTSTLLRRTQKDFQCANRNPQVFNPSAKINEYMLQNCPTADVTITHDEQWMNFRNEGLGNSNIESHGTALSAPLDNEFFSRLIKIGDISVSAGCAMLETFTDAHLIAEDPKLLTGVIDHRDHVARMEPEFSLIFLVPKGWKASQEWETVRLEKLEAVPLLPITTHSRYANVVLSDSSTGAPEVFQTIYNGRKSWKALRGGEMVWPAELEAALIEGLEQYQPDASRETRFLGRFPMRNRFISEYIFRKTGRRRTAKQVGSRLQQLRETCTEKRLMNLLSPSHRPISSSLIHSQNVYQRGLSSLNNDDSVSSSESVSMPITPMDEVASFGFPSHEKQNTDSPGRHTYCIDILPNDATHRHNSAAASASAITDNARRISDEPRPIRVIDPTLAFVSGSLITANSNFTVLVEGVVVFSETTSLTLRDTPPVEATPGTNGLFYTTPLVPGYWKTISESFDPTGYTIYQDIVDTSHASGTLYSAKFRFNYPAEYLASDSPLFSNQHFGLPFDNLPIDYFSTDYSTEMTENGQPSQAYFDDDLWLSPPLIPTEAQLRKAVPSPCEVFNNNSTPGSSSPTSVCFPTELSVYRSETDQMQL